MPVQRSISFISNRFVVLLLVACLALLGVSEYKQWQQKAKINKQIEALKAEAGSVQEKNQELEDSLKYLASTGAAERLARQEMGLKKDGEIPVLFIAPEHSASEPVAEVAQPHWRLWWEYFFHK